MSSDWCRTHPDYKRCKIINWFCSSHCGCQGRITLVLKHMYPTYVKSLQQNLSSFSPCHQTLPRISTWIKGRKFRCYGTQLNGFLRHCKLLLLLPYDWASIDINQYLSSNNQGTTYKLDTGKQRKGSWG
jgi:hypothetical protein